MHYTLTELPYAVDPLPRLDSVRPLGYPILLDSAAGPAPFSRYSILCAGPSERIEPLPDESGEQTLHRIRVALYDLGAPTWPGGIDLPFGAGAVGYLAYDFARRLERLPHQASLDVDFPDLGLGIYLWSVVSDHLLRKCWLVAHPALPVDTHHTVLERLRGTDQDLQPFALASAFAADQPQHQYRAAFERIQSYIHAGDCYQINLAQRFRAQCEGDSLGAYARLRKACPTPFSAYMELAAGSVMSLSPERFLQLRDGVVETRPIKGTRPRGRARNEDEMLARQLQESAKDRAENVMIVDLLRNDLSKTCSPGSVRVPELFAVESYPNVHHLVSSVRGQLAPGEDALSLLAGAFPGGSITGAPKIRAMQIIEELEPVRRSLYCGSIGYIGCEGQMDMNIAIRTLLRQGDELFLWGGGGIVADSEMDSEYQETLTKVRMLMEALG
ncbi:aminodeoxychorismate synthase component I [Halopseudomonas nanhaiensis]|uniref:aminodeoxychorismate synthase component I n=1 Tax=Halopseudomonas nanhaiensis TaxID=2830842 RepID=UPI001CBE04C9|nr:aminodeoxychorismate synthase component I [Halopseudomonas nanhaiensis]UAW97050.1 aminodeoxychorismate synthase component I [Halopseudomonas nanhaiensis]